MKKHYRKGYDKEGHEFTERCETSNNLLGIIGIVIAGILLILLIIFITKDYYKEEFNQEKEKIEMTKKSNQAPTVIVKQVPVQQPQQPQQPVIIMSPSPAQEPNVVSAPAPAKKEKGPIAKAAEKKVVRIFEGEE